MKFFQRITPLLTLLSLMLLVGCASTPKPEPQQQLAIEVTPTIQKIVEKEPQWKWEIETLNKHFKEWQTVKYRYGGLSKKGVDCSGFVYLAFLEQFGVKLPRNTRLQVKLGKTIAKNELKTGDLVFFKTSRHVRHVGIYLDNNQFIHASSSKGVTTSSLKSRYWARKYWTAKRLSPELLKTS